MKKLLLTTLASMALITPSMSSAQQTQNNTPNPAAQLFWEECTGTTQAAIDACIVYIIANENARPQIADPRIRYCIAPTTTLGVVASSMRAQLNSHPQLYGEDPTFVIPVVLAASFPCNQA